MQIVLILNCDLLLCVVSMTQCVMDAHLRVRIVKTILLVQISLFSSNYS